MRLFSAVTTGLAACVAALFATPSTAATSLCGASSPYLATYEFTQLYEVKAIAKYNEYGTCGGSISNSDTAPVGPSLLTDVFAKRDPITRALLLGIATDLPGDPEGQQHLVLFTNDIFAARAQNIAFGTLFPGVNEGSLIDALLSLANGTGSEDDYSLIGGFAGGAAFTGPNGDAGFGLGDSFTSIAFSDGQIIGTGRLFATPATVTAVPEPAAWVMMIVGFGAVGASMRRRRALPAHAAAI